MTLLTAQHRLLRVDQAAAWAGVSPSTVRKWIERGHLPSVVLDGRVLVGDRDLLDCERARRRGGRRESTGGADGSGS